MTTVYKVGDTLYERKMVVGGDYRAVDTIREWTVLSVVDDLLFEDEDGRPCQVVTLRAFMPERAIYMTEIAPYIDISVEHGCWRRTRAEAEAMR